MKILHTVYDDLQNPWWGGGGAVRVYEVCRRLAKRHEITVLTGNFPGARREEEIEGIRYVRIGSPRGRWASRLSYSLLTPGYVKRSGCDLWVNHFSAFSPVVTERRPCLLVLHNVVGLHAIRKYPIIGLVSLIAEEYVLRSYHSFAVSPSLEALVQKKCFGRECHIRCIVNGTDLSSFTVTQTEGNYILYLGRLDIYAKGLDLLVSAFAEVKRRRPAIRLKIAGGGKDASSVRNLVRRLGLSDHIDLLGSVSEEDKRRLISGSLFVCIPSRFEGFPIVAIEAAAAGKAIVGTAIPGLSDATVDGQTSVLVAPNSLDALSEAILSLLADQSERHRLGENGRAYSMQFDWDRIAADEENYYTSVVADRKAP